jgi:hypothetical protein
VAWCSTWSMLEQTSTTVRTSRCPQLSPQVLVDIQRADSYSPWQLGGARGASHIGETRMFRTTRILVAGSAALVGFDAIALMRIEAAGAAQPGPVAPAVRPVRCPGRIHLSRLRRTMERFFIAANDDEATPSRIPGVRMESGSQTSLGGSRGSSTPRAISVAGGVCAVQQGGTSRRSSYGRPVVSAQAGTPAGFLVLGDAEILRPCLVAGPVGSEWRTRRPSRTTIQTPRRNQ